MKDDTEDTRRELISEGVRRVLISEINADPDSREALEKEHGQVWDTQELGNDFEVKGFMSPFVVVKRKSDGVEGSLMFQHAPRYYFSFTKD